MTKAQAFAQGITLCRWRNMRYRTASGKERLAAYRQNAFHATEIYHSRYPDLSNSPGFKDLTATPATKRKIKRLQEQNRQLKIELHCREMRAVHSARAAAKRRLQECDKVCN
jgi:hypothetical protein